MYDCIETMVGFRINWYWYACWMVTAPAFMLVSVVHQSLTYFYNHTRIIYFIKIVINDFSHLFSVLVRILFREIHSDHVRKNL